MRASRDEWWVSRRRVWLRRDRTELRLGNAWVPCHLHHLLPSVVTGLLVLVLPIRCDMERMLDTIGDAGLRGLDWAIKVGI